MVESVMVPLATPQDLLREEVYIMARVLMARLGHRATPVFDRSDAPYMAWLLGMPKERWASVDYYVVRCMLQKYYEPLLLLGYNLAKFPKLLPPVGVDPRKSWVDVRADRMGFSRDDEEMAHRLVYYRQDLREFAVQMLWAGELTQRLFATLKREVPSAHWMPGTDGFWAVPEPMAGALGRFARNHGYHLMVDARLVMDRILSPTPADMGRPGPERSFPDRPLAERPVPQPQLRTGVRIGTPQSPPAPRYTFQAEQAHQDAQQPRHRPVAPASDDGHRRRTAPKNIKGVVLNAYGHRVEFRWPPTDPQKVDILKRFQHARDAEFGNGVCHYETNRKKGIEEDNFWTIELRKDTLAFIDDAIRAYDFPVQPAAVEAMNRVGSEPDPAIQPSLLTEEPVAEPAGEEPGEPAQKARRPRRRKGIDPDAPMMQAVRSRTGRAAKAESPA